MKTFPGRRRRPEARYRAEVEKTQESMGAIQYMKATQTVSVFSGLCGDC